MVNRPHSGIAALLGVASVLLVLLPAQMALAAPARQTTCGNVIMNGGFETGGYWTLGPGPLAPAYVSSPVHNGSFAMQMGNVGQPNQQANSWIYQRITIPYNAVSADLSFWVWLQSAAGAGADLQQVVLMVPGATDLSHPYQVLWSQQTNAPSWQNFSVSLLGQQGRTFDLYFNVYNDGAGGSTAMVADDVSLTICQPVGPTATPTQPPFPTLTPTVTPWPTPSSQPSPVSSPTVTPWPTPAGSATPVPSNCVELATNGGFETTGGWLFGWDPLVPFYNGDPAFVYSGVRSMAMGAVNQPSVTTPAYSSIRQDITLPANAATASITFWYYPISDAAPGGLNRQELILLDPLAYGETVAVLWRVTENNQGWLQKTADLTPYLGRTLSVYFNARNAGDGTRTAMYLDEVSVVACDSAMAVPYAANPADSSGQQPVAPATGGFPDAQPLPAAAQAAAGATVISVAPTSPVTPAPGSTALPTPLPNEEPRRERTSFLDNLDLNISTPAAVIGIGLAALLIVIFIVWFFRRREREKTVSPSSTVPESSDTSDQGL